MFCPSSRGIFLMPQNIKVSQSQAAQDQAKANSGQFVNVFGNKVCHVAYCVVLLMPLLSNCPQ